MDRRHQGTAGSEKTTGRLLVTTDHEVIMHWAEQRAAEPALTSDDAATDEADALRFTAKGDHGGGLAPVSWEEWLGRFDRAGLRFVYQDGQPYERPDTRPDGDQDYYRLERPDHG